METGYHVDSSVIQHNIIPKILKFKLGNTYAYVKIDCQM